MTATNTTTGEVASSAPSDIAVTVNPGPEAPSLAGTVLTASGVEGTAIPLTITATPVDGDDVLSISVSGVPLDATLSAGTNNGGGNWTLTAAQLSGLKLNAGETAATLHVTATNTTTGEVASSATSDIAVTVNPGPEAPSLAGTVLTASGVEGTAIPLTITATPVDGDDVLSISVSGVPLDATLSAGTNNGGGNWTLTAPQLVGLKLNAGETSGTLHVTATNTTTGEVASSAPSDIAVTVNPLAETPIAVTLTPSASTVGEGSSVTLAVSAIEPDGDGTLSYTLSGIPSDATLSNANGALTPSGGSITLAANQLAGLTLKLGETTAALSLTATNTEGASTATSAAVSATVTATPVAEAPSLTGTVLAASGVEGTAIPLTITATPVDGDDVLSISISGVPLDATLSAGTNNGGGNWTLTAPQLVGLTLNAGVTSGTLHVTATNTTTGEVASTTNDIVVTVTSSDVDTSPETPSLAGTVLTASGVEDTAIPLTITATPVDGDDVLSISVSGVPLDATLSAGTNNGGGSWTLTAPQLSGLKLNAGETSGTLHVIATNTTTGEVASSATSDIAVTVSPAPEAPSLAGTVLTASGNEGTAIPLTITATPVDGDDVLSIGITGVPLDATLSAGTNNGGGNWTLTAAQLVGLKLNAGETSGTLHVTATNTTTGEVASSAPSDIAVTVNPGPEAPSLAGTVLTASGVEGTAIPLTITATPVDGDDVLSISVSGVPLDATLSAGTNNGGGNWTLTAAQLSGLKLNAGETAATLHVTATNTTTGEVASSAPSDIAVTVNPGPEAPSLAGTVLTASGVEGTAIPLTITATPVDGDDVLSISVSGVPLDATLSAGTNNGGGNWTLTAPQLVGLKLNAGETAARCT